MGTQPPDGISLEESREIARLHFIGGIEEAERLSERPYDLLLKGALRGYPSNELEPFERWLPLWAAAQQKFMDKTLQELKNANPFNLSLSDRAMVWEAFTQVLPVPLTVQPVFEIKNLKDWIGEEGPGFTVDLWIDGRKACLVRNNADGGNYHYDWIDRDLKKVFDAYVKNLPVRFDDEFPISSFGSAGDDDGTICAVICE